MNPFGNGIAGKPGGGGGWDRERGGGGGGGERGKFTPSLFSQKKKYGLN